MECPGATPGEKFMLKPQKNFVGPQLRQLRREHGQTQAGMAQALGLSPAYINLLENNQRSLSVQVLLRLSEVYGKESADGGVDIDIRLSQQDLADLVGTTRESVNKQLRSWEEQVPLLRRQTKATRSLSY